MRTVLQCFAKSFRSQEFATATHYAKSFETDCLGDFISHDWASGRVSKLLALCLIYNSIPAMVISGLTAVGLSVLQHGDDPFLPIAQPSKRGEDWQRSEGFGYWVLIVSQLVFGVVFLAWQDLRSWLCLGCRRCFVDKFCIDQTNPERKAAGILGLAGFLRCSDRFIILWTPRYFTRLWCTYEVASWLFLEKPLTSVLFMPLAHANVVMSLMISGWACSVLLAALAPLFPDIYVYLVFSAFLLGFAVGAHQARHCARHLRAIPAQLQDFSVTSSRCFCCSSGHRYEGKNIPCDREVVYTTIAEWFSDAGDEAFLSKEDRLDSFDQAVRLHFAGQVLQKAGPTQLAYRYVVVIGWPYVFRIFDQIGAGHWLDQSWGVNFMYVTIIFAASPIWYKAAMHLACLVDSRIGIPRWKCLDMLLSLVLAFVYLVLVMLVWVPLEMLATRLESPIPLLLAGFTYFALNSFVYHSDLKECFCKRRWRRHSRSSQSSSVGLAEAADAAADAPADATVDAPAHTTVDATAGLQVKEISEVRPEAEEIRDDDTFMSILSI